MENRIALGVLMLTLVLLPFTFAAEDLGTGLDTGTNNPNIADETPAEKMVRMLEAFDEGNFNSGTVIFSFSDSTTQARAVSILEKYGLSIGKEKICGGESNIGSPSTPETCSFVDSWEDSIKIARVIVPVGEEKALAKKLVESEVDVLWAEPNVITTVYTDDGTPLDQKAAPNKDSTAEADKDSGWSAGWTISIIVLAIIVSFVIRAMKKK